MGEQQKQPACTQQHYVVHPRDLPVSCPTAEMAEWNAHPRVYLDMTDGKASCPYCGAVYELAKED